MRIGIFGGTFDPPHYGHLIVAEQAREQAALDQVWFLLSARPPHKSDRTITPFDRRADMLTLALAGHEDKFRVETIENDRPGLSYTSDTLDGLSEKHPDTEWFLILGADSVKDLPTWHEPQRIVSRAKILIAARPGHPSWSAAQLASAVAMPTQDVRVGIVEVPLIDIASRDLRHRVADSRSILFQLPRAVEVYIREKKLYARG